MKKILTKYVLIEIWLILELFLFCSLSSVNNNREIASIAGGGDRLYVISKYSVKSYGYDGRLIWEYGSNGAISDAKTFRKKIYILSGLHLSCLSSDGVEEEVFQTETRYKLFAKISEYYVFYDGLKKNIVFTHYGDARYAETSYWVGTVKSLENFNGKEVCILSDSGIFLADAGNILKLDMGFLPSSVHSFDGKLMLESGSGEYYLWSDAKISKIKISIPKAPFILNNFEIIYFDSTVVRRKFDE